MTDLVWKYASSGGTQDFSTWFAQKGWGSVLVMSQPGGIPQSNLTSKNNDPGRDSFWTQSASGVTWEQTFGLPSGSTITGIVSGSCDSKCLAFNTPGSTPEVMGAKIISGATTFNVANSRTFTGTDGSFVTTNGTDLTGVSIPSSDTVQVELYNNLSTGASGGAQIEIQQDNLQFTIQYTAPATDPDPPTSLVATAVGGPTGGGKVSIAFTPGANGGSPITGYTSTSTPDNRHTTSASSPLVADGLADGISYTFTIHATNANGNSSESAPSNAATPSTVPNQPTNVVAQGHDGKADVTCTSPDPRGSPITSYTATSTPGGHTGTGATLPVTVSGLSNGTSYTFTIHATNANGDSDESTVSNPVIPFGCHRNSCNLIVGSGI